MSDDLKRSGGFIPGVRPGLRLQILDKVMSLITFPGSLFLALIAVFPAIVSLMDVQQSYDVLRYLINYGWCRNRYNSTN
jgi:preprotein translocase subunit SecY